MSSAIHTFTLEPDNPSNTEVRDIDSKVVYTAETVFPENTSKTLTHVRNGDGDILATLEWRDILSDKVTFRGETKAKSVGDWLKKSIVPFSTTVKFKDARGRKYKWEGCGPGLQLELYAEDNSSKSPIAQFSRSHKGNKFGTEPYAAKLIMTESALEIRDEVVMSFLFLEKSRRTLDTSVQSKADVLGTPDISVGNHVALNKGGVGS